MNSRRFSMITVMTLMMATLVAIAAAGVQAAPTAKKGGGGKPTKAPTSTPGSATATPTPGSGGPQGTVYYKAWAAPDTIVKSDPSGGNQTSLTGYGTQGNRFIGSRSVHDGDAYFLRTEFDDPTPVYPDGHPIRDLYAYDESANRVALTSLDASIQAVGGHNWSYDDDRSLEDGVVLFTAREFDTGGNVTTAGIYQVQVAFDTGGAITGPVAGSLTQVAPAPLITNGSRGLFPDVSYISANGAGTEVVYDRISDGALMRTAFPTTSTNHTALGISGRGPEWSPTENLIAYSSGYDIYTATSTGGNATKIVSGRARRGNKAGYSYGGALFSHSGDHLLLSRAYDPGGSGNPTEVYRVAKGGSGLTKIDDSVGATGWVAP